MSKKISSAADFSAGQKNVVSNNSISCFKRAVNINGKEMKKKAISQRGSGSFVPSHLNDMTFYTDSIPNPGPKVNTKPSAAKAVKDVIEHDVVIDNEKRIGCA